MTENPVTVFIDKITLKFYNYYISNNIKYNYDTLGNVNAVYSTMYDKYGFKKMQNIIARIYEFVVGLAI